MSGLKIKNMEDFASVSGISRPTLSRYFNDPDSVRVSTKKRIEDALDQHEFRPNVYAMNQNRRQTKNIGIVVPYLADPFFAEMARNIEGIVIAAGFHPILLSSHGDPKQEIDNLDSLRSIKPAGVLLAPLGRASNNDAVDAFCKDVSTVLFDSNLENIGEAFVGMDNNQSIEIIVDYLCKSGDLPAFFEMKNPTNPNAYKRRNAYITSMEKFGHTPNLIQVEGDGWNFEEIGFREGSKIINSGKLPSKTILCSNDRLAIGFLSATYEAGLRVGVEKNAALRVAGHDDHPFARYTCPPLTTVSQNYVRITQRSTETLLNIIETGDQSSQSSQRETTLFDGKLVVRASA